MVSPLEVLYSETTEGIQLGNPAGINGNTLGVVRSSAVPSAINGGTLAAAAKGQATTLWNPNKSTGCSFILRGLFLMSGLPHSVVEEILNDEQPYGHKGGNAIDLYAGDISNVDGQMGALADFIRSMPALFACVSYTNADNPEFSVYVWDGVVQDDATGLGNGGAAFAADCYTKMHVSSSKSRILTALAYDDDVLSNIGDAATPIGYGVDDIVYGVPQPETSGGTIEPTIGMRW